MCLFCVQPLSHLYKNTGAIVGAYLRIDIPKLPQLDQYNYVLFTGACRRGEGSRVACGRGAADALCWGQWGASLSSWPSQGEWQQLAIHLLCQCPCSVPADCDVYFRKRMKLIDWGSPLPAAIGMG